MVKHITFNDADGTYTWSIDGEGMGVAPTRIQAQLAADNAVYQALQRDTVDAADLTPEEAVDMLTAQQEIARSDAFEAAMDEERRYRIPNMNNLTRQRVAQERIKARMNVVDDPRWMRALNTAAVELEVGSWCFNGRFLVICSRTSERYYRCTATTCQCPGFARKIPCWHRAAARLVELAVSEQG